MTSRPNIALIGTGGTIAGSAASPTSATRYTPGSLGVDAILAAIPELSERYTDADGDMIADILPSHELAQQFQLGECDWRANQFRIFVHRQNSWLTR